jgi:hypothetical protein
VNETLKNPDNVDLSDVHYRIINHPVLGHMVAVVQDFDYPDYDEFSTRRVYPYTPKAFKKAWKKADKLNDEREL